MRLRTKFDAGQTRAIRRAMLTAPDKSAFQRLQCLWLRAYEDLPTTTIANAAGLSVSHVRRVWSDYLRHGMAGVQGQPRRGWLRRNLTPEQEREILEPLEKLAEAGQPVTARDVQSRYESMLGRPVPIVSVYRLLARHQWQRKNRRRKPAARRHSGTISGSNRRPSAWLPGRLKT